MAARCARYWVTFDQNPRKQEVRCELDGTIRQSDSASRPGLYRTNEAGEIWLCATCHQDAMTPIPDWVYVDLAMEAISRQIDRWAGHHFYEEVV